MVPCHGVTVTESLEGADRRDSDWFLLDYQKNKDVPRALVGHIQGGLDELDADQNSLLLFSGKSVAYRLSDAPVSRYTPDESFKLLALQQGPPTANDKP